MLPYEVVTRREAHGSYLKRHPHIAKGQLFPQLLVEFYLKTKDKDWKGKPLVADDPLMDFADGGSQIRLLNPAKPVIGQEPFLILPASDVLASNDEWKIFPEMRRIARQAFLVLEKAWQLQGGTLVDLKVEFGYDSKGRLLLADVIDNNSWRVIEDGSYIDKQVYRDGGALDDVAAKYRRVAEITDRFQLPRQRIILWRGSETDKTDPFVAALGELKDMMTVVTCSVHKEPVRAAATLYRMAQEVPDTHHDRQYRTLERRRADAVGDVDRPGDHRAGERQGVSRGRVVVAAGAEQGAGDDGAGAVERGAGGAADPLRPQPAALRACARGDRGADGEYDFGLIPPASSGARRRRRSDPWPTSCFDPGCRSRLPDDGSAQRYSFLIPAWVMMSRNIGTSLATRAMWPLPSCAVTSKPDCVSLARISGRLRISSATFSS